MTQSAESVKSVCPLLAAALLLQVSLVFVGIASPLGAAEYFVAPDGADGNSGIRNAPFRTIQKATDLMRPGDTCYVRAGVYRETVRPKRSGTKAKPIRFQAWPGDVVVLSGTKPLRADWVVHKGKIYRTRVSESFDQLFVDGRMMIEARWPNMRFEQRFDKSVWAVAGKDSEYGTMVDPALAETGIDWTGAVATLNVASWKTYRRIVQNHETGGDRFNYEKNLADHVEAKRYWENFDHYFLSGKLEALDAPSEWYLDLESQTLYLWAPDGENPAGRNIEVKVRDYAFDARQCSFIELCGFHFFGATFTFDDCNDCVVEGCHLRFPNYPHGLDPAPPTLIDGERNVMQNCSVVYGNGSGVKMKGKNNRLENCLMHDLDWHALGLGHGVQLGRSDASVIRRCTFFNLGSSEGLVVPWSGPSVVEYNYIHHAGLVQSDGALIQSAGIRLAGTEIRYNWVHNHNAFNWGGNGIRGDDLSRDLSVHHNVVWNCSEKGIIVKGDHNRVYNNTCLNNDEIDILATSRAEPFKPWATFQHPHLLKQQNANTHIANNCAPAISGTFKWEKKQIPPLGVVENNYSGNAPGFVDSGRRDFRPAPGSPLIDAGKKIEGTIDVHQGAAPDIGAYEHGRPRWVPGYRNMLWLLRDEEGRMTARLYMPPLEPVVFAIKGALPENITFTSDNWMEPQEIRSKEKYTFVENPSLNVREKIDTRTIKHLQGKKIVFHSVP